MGQSKPIHSTFTLPSTKRHIIYCLNRLEAVQNYLYVSQLKRSAVCIEDQLLPQCLLIQKRSSLPLYPKLHLFFFKKHNKKIVIFI